MVLWWRMVQLELPLWSQISTTSHTPIHYLQCRSSPLSCWLSRWPCNTSARYQSLPSPLLSAATPRRRWQPSSPTFKTHGRISCVRSRQLPRSWSPAVRKFAFSGYQRTSASLETRRRTEQQKEEPRELTPRQWRWKSAWPTYMRN